MSTFKITGLVLPLVLVLVSSCTDTLVRSQNTPDTNEGHERQLQVAENNRVWQPATFRGLVLGTSKVEDLESLFGKPLATAIDESEQGENSYMVLSYEIDEPFAGTIRVDIDKRTRIIDHIELTPEILSKHEVIAHFGTSFVITKYNFDSCLEDFDSAPIYESSTGAISFMEYRDKGVAISLSDDGKTVRLVSFVSEPVGAAFSQCALE